MSSGTLSPMRAFVSRARGRFYSRRPPSGRGARISDIGCSNHKKQSHGGSRRAGCMAGDCHSGGVARQASCQRRTGHASKVRHRPSSGGQALRRHRNEPTVLGDRRSRAGASHGVRGAARRASPATPQARWTLSRHRRARYGVGTAHVSQVVGRDRAALPRSREPGHRRCRVLQIRHDVRQPDHRD